MSQISQQYIQPGVRRKLEFLLIDCIRRCTNQETTVEFLNDLMTDTEKVMLAKRVAISLMILKGNSYQTIKETLKVSVGTIWKVKLWLDQKGNGFRTLLAEVLKHDEQQERSHREVLQDAIENNPSILHYQLNWSEYKKKQWKKVKETPKEPF